MNHQDQVRATIQYLRTVLSRYRLNYSTELILQNGIEQVFAKEGIECRREAVLDPRNRVDFMVGPIAVEVKTAGSPARVYSQLKRYAKFSAVEGILLVTGRHMAVPPEIEGKPAAIHFVGNAWL